MASILLIGLTLLGGVFIGLVIGSQVSSWLNRILSRLALVLFRDDVESQGRHQNLRSRNLQAIHATVTYPVYASKTLLYTVMVGGIGSIAGVYVFYTVSVFLTTAEATVRRFLPPYLHFILDVSAPPGLRPLIPTGVGFGGVTPIQVFVLLLISSATFGLLASGLTYYLRWWYVRSEANRREVLIDESLARTIAFIYALSRSGMLYPEVIRTVAANRKSFGESAEEVGVVVKDMDLFGSDLVTALQRIANRTPSEQFRDFAENFANVLRSGRNVSAYLQEQYEQYQEERIENQERLLELFTALGEGYVAALVAGPLFLITVLIIFGILSGGLLEFLQVLVYFLIPIANIGFVLYLDTLSSSLTDYQVTIRHDISRRNLSVRKAFDRSVSRADGGATSDHRDRNHARLMAYNRLSRWYQAVWNPVETVLSNPPSLFTVTVPVAFLYFGGRVWVGMESGALGVRILDDIIIQSVLLVIGSFAIVQEIHTRRIRNIEDAVPDLLDRLASTNEAGMTFTEGLKRVDRSDLGALDVEVSRLINDIEWGSRTERALYRFSDRIGSSTIARIVALITNAMLASGHVGPVIRIAADEAREDARLRTKRRQEMFMYLLIIYLAFFVFLGIAVALQTILIPAIPSASELATLAPPDQLGMSMPIAPTSGTKKAAYTTILFHGAIVQAVCSGFVAGQMGEGRVLNGAKHATAMVLLAYAVFLMFA